MKRFACQDIIPGCDHVFTGADDQSVLDQVIAHAAVDHGLVKPPLALVELVVATTHTFVPAKGRGHLRLVGAPGPNQHDPSSPDDHSDANSPDGEAVVATIPAQRSACSNSHVVTIATDRFRRAGAPGQPDVPPDDPVDGVNDGPATAVEGAEGSSAPGDHTQYRHECVMYSGIDEFVAMAVTFIAGGLDRNQPVLVAVIEPRLRAIRDALGDAADRVVFIDMAELGQNPARILPEWRDFVARSGGRPMRGVGEPIWAGRRATEIVECQFLESLLNVAVDPDTPLWLLCPYDIASLTDDVIAEARRAHPVVGSSPRLDDRGSQHSAELRTADGQDDGIIDHLQALFTAELPAPLRSATSGTYCSTRDLAVEVLQQAAAAGIATMRSVKLATAVGEIAAAGAGQSGGPVDVRFWQDEHALVCEVRDDGVICDPMVGRGTTLVAQTRDRSIRLANELCDLVQVRSGTAGTTVRVHSWI